MRRDTDKQATHPHCSSLRRSIQARNKLINGPSSGLKLSFFFSHARLGEVDLYTSGGLYYSVEPWQIVKHPGYRSRQSYYDVAVIYLRERLTYSDFVRPICLPGAPDSDPDTNMGQFATPLGTYQEYLSMRVSSNRNIYFRLGI